MVQKRRTLLRCKRALKRALLAVLAALGLVAVYAIVDGWSAFGKNAEGDRRARMEASVQWGEGVFANPEPLWNDLVGSLTTFIGASDYGSPDAAIPTVQIDPDFFEVAPQTGLRVTWFGHSSVLVEIDGVRILTDPVWGERSSPLTWAGPQRWYEPPLALADLPAVDAVILSHDHYDHLDYPTIVALRDRVPVFIAPLGVGAHLEYWGVAPDRIVEVDWWDKTTVKGLEVVCTPARHASGRHILDQNATLWAGYALLGPQHRVYFSGDTGLFSAMERIGTELGPFDLTMIETGAYDQAWPDWHIGPEQAVLAHQITGGKVFFGVHWGLFNLASHGWTEPVERTVAAAEAAGVEFVVPKPGQSFEPGAPPAFERWWPERPWRTAADYPVVSTQVDDLRAKFQGLQGGTRAPESQPTEPAQAR